MNRSAQLAVVGSMMGAAAFAGAAFFVVKPKPAAAAPGPAPGAQPPAQSIPPIIPQPGAIQPTPTPTPPGPSGKPPFPPPVIPQPGVPAPAQPGIGVTQPGQWYSSGSLMYRVGDPKAYTEAEYRTATGYKPTPVSGASSFTGALGNSSSGVTYYVNGDIVLRNEFYAYLAQHPEVKPYIGDVARQLGA